MATKPVKWDQDQIDLAEKLASEGISNFQIAKALGHSRSFILESKPIADAIKKGRKVALQAIEAKAYQMALSGECYPMTMFWLKCQAGWKDKQEVDINVGFKPIVIERQSGAKIELNMSSQKKEIEDGQESKEVQGEGEG